MTLQQLIIPEVVVPLVCSSLPAAALYRASSLRSRYGWWLLAVVWALLVAGALANIAMFTSHQASSLATPLLRNPDAGRWYYLALSVASGVDPMSERLSASLPYALVMRFAGANVATFIAVNIACYTSALVLTARLAARVAGERMATIANTAMTLTAIVLYLTVTATLPLKEPMVTLALMLIATALVGLRRRITVGYLAIFTVACCLLALVRVQFMIFTALGVVAILADRNSRSIALCAGLLVFAGVVSMAYYRLFPGLEEFYTVGAFDPGGLANSFITEDDGDHSFYNVLATAYYAMTWWKRLLCLPVTAAVQYLIPLPWTAMGELPYGYTMVAAHIGLGWYCTGGLMLYTLLFRLRRSGELMLRLTLWGAAAWVSLAYFTAGLVSRYGLPLVPLLAPAAAAAWVLWRRDRSFRIYAVIYCGLIFIALAASFILQYR